jgi:PIN domain nuclease of toxin-antitoxin system
MRILLDTHIYLWHVSDSNLLTDKARSIILDADSIYISSATLWEIAIKVKLGKLSSDLNELIETLRDSGFQELPVESRHAVQIAKLPLLHGDPFDRMLIAQAMVEQLHLVTADSQLSQYSDRVIRI